MVGSVREAADLVVTDPLQAGVMAVMAIADTARFDISKQRRRQYLTPETTVWARLQSGLDAVAAELKFGPTP